MRRLVLLGVVGFIAQLVDGSLGMAYGASSATLLLAVGVAPALASASVHLSEVATTFASGVSHWRFGNVDWGKLGWMTVPGALGAFIGAFAISYVSAEAAAPIVALFLFGLGVYILSRFAFRRNHRLVVVKPISRRFLSPLGLVAGFLDAAGGGGWGAINTSTLLSTGRMEPRKVVGTVDTSEFLVSVAASVGFLFALSFADIPWGIVGALLVGGVVAAPLAAYVVRLLPARILGTAVAGIILLTNMQTFLETVGVGGTTATVIYVLIALVSLSALAWAIFVTTHEDEPQVVEGEAA
ncbi:MAG TPA: sulfite exporter TauE/SafE family protein [Rubrobacter sp.]|nr:sulfite exporter TauE/SafE family protein [Rubrobacter sp.]